MDGLYFIPVTILLCSITCVNGQALYEERCMAKNVQDVEQFKGNSPFKLHIL